MEMCFGRFTQSSQLRKFAAGMFLCSCVTGAAHAQTQNLWGWGDNSYGQVGTGNVTKVESPVHILDSVSRISAGAHVLAVKEDGTLFSWGSNVYGQTGIGSISERVLTPTLVPGLSGITAAAVGESHSIALRNDGTLWGWGANDLGQLGLGTYSDFVLIPIQVPISGVVSIAANRDASYVVKSDGTLWAWGFNASGKLGIGSDEASSYPSPVQIHGIENVASIVSFANIDTVYAVKTNGEVWGWGYNDWAELNLTRVNSNSPIQIQKAVSVESLACSWNTVLAIQSGGSVLGWGTNAAWMLSESNDWAFEPFRLDFLGSSVASVAAGWGIGIVANKDGTVWTWSHVSDYQKVASLSAAKSVAVGGSEGNTCYAICVQPSANVSMTMAVNPVNGGTTSPAAGTVNPVKQSVPQTITAGQADGYLFHQWTGAGVSFGNDMDAATTAALSADATVTANFIPKATAANLTMAVNDTLGGSTSPTAGKRSYAVPLTKETAIVATPNSKYYSFTNWEVVGGATVTDPISAKTSVILTGDARVTAVFAPLATTTILTMAVNDPNGGSTIPATGSYPVVKGVSFNISASAVKGYSFQGWNATANAVLVSMSNASTTATISGDATITAIFASTTDMATLTMAVNDAKGGAVTPSVGAHSVVKGSATAITAAPASGFAFIGWTSTGGAALANASSASTTATLSSDATVTANFIRAVTVSSEFYVLATDVFGSTATTFTGAPKLTAYYNDPVSGKKSLKATIKVLTSTKSYPTDKILCQWTKKIVLCDKKKFDKTKDTAANIKACQVPYLTLNSIECILSKSKVKSTLAFSMAVMPPSISKLLNKGQEVQSAALNQELTIQGAYFTNKAPTVSFDYKDAKGIYKSFKCKVTTKKDFMDMFSGASSMAILTPKSLPKDCASGAVVNLFIDNGIGLAAVPCRIQ